MKTNKQVAQIWASGDLNFVQSGNMFAKMGTIYSYGQHYPIACFIKNAVFINPTSYSNTTAKHKLEVYRAIGNKEVVPAWPHNDNKTDIYYSNTYQSLMAKLGMAKKPEIYQRQIDSLKSQYARYCELMHKEPNTLVFK